MNMIHHPPHRPDAAATSPVLEAVSLPDARPAEPPGGGPPPAMPAAEPSLPAVRRRRVWPWLLGAAVLAAAGAALNWDRIAGGASGVREAAPAAAPAESLAPGEFRL